MIMGSKKIAVFKQIAVVLLLIAGTVSGYSQDKAPDPWEPVRFLIGTWQGTASGEAGAGTVVQSYEFISNDEFIETFELAPAGKPFEVYSRNHFKRVP